MKRVAVVLGVLAAVVAALLGVALLVSLEPRPAEGPENAAGPDGRGGRRLRAKASPPDATAATADDPDDARTDDGEPAPVEPPADPRPDPGYAGVVHGTVMRAENSAGIAGATVTLLHPTGDVIASTTSDDAGRYRFSCAPEHAPLVLRLEHPDYVDGVCCDLLVTRGRAAQKDARLAEAPHMTVVVRTPGVKGRPATATVRLLRGDDEVFRGITDDAGRVAIRTADPGWHELRVEGDGFADPPPRGLRAVDDWEREVLVLEGGRLTVRVRQRGGTPAEGVKVQLTQWGLEPPAETTDDNGEAFFAHLYPNALWTVTCTRPDGLQATKDVTILDAQDNEAEVVFPASGAVEGVVTSQTNEPLADVEVRIRGPAGRSPGVSGLVRTDEGGRFTWPAVAVGDWAVGVPGGAGPAWRDVHVSAGEVVRVRLVVPAHEARQVIGRVVRQDGSAAGGLRLRLDPTESTATTSGWGDFRFDGVDPTKLHTVASLDPEWRVVAAGDGGPATLRASSTRAVEEPLIAQRTAVRLDLPVDGPATDADPAEVAARFPRRIALTGTVQGAELTPLGAVAVTCRGVQAYTAPDGSFALPDVPALDEDDILSVHLAPPPGMYLPTIVTVDAPRGRAPPEQSLRLVQRPYMRIATSDGDDADGRAGSARIVSSLPDRFLGTAVAPFEVIEALSLDGAWIHLPPTETEETGSALVLVARDGATGTELNWDRWDRVRAPRFELRGVRDPKTHAQAVTLDLPPQMGGTFTIAQESVGLPWLSDVELPRTLGSQLANSERVRTRYAAEESATRTLRLERPPGTYRVTWVSDDRAIRRAITITVPGPDRVSLR